MTNDPQADTPVRSRRKLTRVEGHPGIYWFDCAPHGKTHYEYEYRAGGRQRWVVIHDTLQAAIKDRNRKLGDPSRLTKRAHAFRTLSDLMAWHLTRQESFVRPSTLTSYRTSWAIAEPMLGAERLDRLEPDDVERKLLALLEATAERRAYALKTVYHVRAVIRAACMAALAKRLIAVDPLPEGSVRLPAMVPTPRPFLTVRQLLNAWDVLEGDRDGRLVLGLCGFAGLRRSEVLALVGGDLNPSPELLKTFVAVGERPPGLSVLAVKVGLTRDAEGHPAIYPVKTVGSRRPVPLIPMVAELIEGTGANQRVWRVPPGVGEIDHIDRAWSARMRILGRAGVPPVTMHELRHSAATLLADAHVHEWTAHRSLGHVLPNVAGRYVHPTWDQMLEQVRLVAAHLESVRLGTGTSAQEE